jgi:hypothetical protein
MMNGIDSKPASTPRSGGDIKQCLPREYGSRSNAVIRAASLICLLAAYMTGQTFERHFSEGWAVIGIFVVIGLALFTIFAPQTSWCFDKQALTIITTSLVTTQTITIDSEDVVSLSIRTMIDSDGPDTYKLALQTRSGEKHKIHLSEKDTEQVLRELTAAFGYYLSFYH